MIAYVFQKYPENLAFELFIILPLLSVKFAIFLKDSLLFNSFYRFFFLFINKTLRLINLKTRTAMNAKISVVVICVQEIICLFLHNLHDCTFNSKSILK